MSKHKVGDKVIICDNNKGNHCIPDEDISKYIGKEAIITKYIYGSYDNDAYKIDLDNGDFYWATDNFFVTVKQDQIISLSDGASCNRCKEFNPYVPSSKTFVCYGCKRGSSL